MGALQGLRTGEALTDARDVVSPNMQVSADIIHGNILPSHPPLRSRERYILAQEAGFWPEPVIRRIDDRAASSPRPSVSEAEVGVGRATISVEAATSKIL